MPWTVDTARAEELADAFGLIFRHVRGEERAARVSTALELIRLGLLDATGIKVARGATGVVGAVIAAAVAGAGGIVWPAQAADAEIEEQLMGEALAWLRGHGAKLAQALLADHERDLGAGLLRAGFTHVTDLWYFRHELDAIPRRSASTITCQTYAECDVEIFHQTLLRTYEETLDCPEVNGVRDITEVIAGHRSQGTHDAKLWWLAWQGGMPVGVVLLTTLADAGWDLIYLGVVKEARGRGIGRDMTAHALAAARAAKARQLTLSVDVRNQPAWNLYRSAGFEPYDQRVVYLCIF
jgi:ribosomal protein S18 acetylase RimI-like enzyme